MHSVFSGYFFRLDAITMPSGLDVMALDARKRVHGCALVASLAASGYRRVEPWLLDSPRRAAPACCRCRVLLLPSVPCHDNIVAATVPSLAHLDAAHMRLNHRCHAIYGTAVCGPRRPRARVVG